MKSIKTTFVRGLSLLLALVIVLSLPISAFAAVTIPDWNATYTYKYDAERAELIDSSIFRALKYLKYDRYNELGNNGYLFTDRYVGGSLLTRYNDGDLKYNPFTDVAYANKAYGTATTRDEDGNIIPDVEALEAGLVCNSFCEYYYFNYLINIEKMDVKYLYNAYYEGVDRINAGKETYSEDGWYEMAETLVADGKAYAYYFDPEDSVTTEQGATTADQQRYLEMFETLPIGALIRFGDPSLNEWGDEFKHYAVYAGTADGLHFIIHTANKKRGPEISTVERMATSGTDKDSYPLAFYVFDNVTPEESYGSITVYKDDPDGKPLAGAKFKITYEDGTYVYVTTGADGYAYLSDLLLGTYTIQETDAPDGYELDNTKYTVTLSKDKPDGGGPIHVTNTPITGSLTVYKDDPDGKPLAGAKFLVQNKATGASWTITTDSTGYASLDNLPLGTYTIEETEAPKGYERDDTVHTVTLTENNLTGGEPIHVTNTPKLGSLKIIKNILPSSAATAGNLIGWQFKVYKNSPSFTTTIRDGVQYRVKVTDKNGNFIYSDPALMSNQETSTGSIHIQSLTPSEGALVNIGEEQIFTVDVASTGCAYQWQIQTTPDGGWTNLAGQTKATMSLTMTEEYKNSKVRVRIIKLPGTVLYSDPITFATPDSFCIVSGPQDIIGTDGKNVTMSVTANGEGLVYQWEMYDEATGEWISVDEQFGGTFNTGTAGTNQIKDIPVGDYYVVEIDTGREGWSYDLTPKAVTISEDNTAELPYEVTFTNELLQGGVLIQKVTEDGRHLIGWRFGLYSAPSCDPEYLVAQTTTVSGGQLRFTNFSPGTYWVMELGHVSASVNDLYYCASENPQKVTVEAGKTATVQFENRLRTGTGKVVKTTTNGGSAAGWQFHFWTDTADLGIYTTDGNGEIVLDNLLPGTVYVQEVGHETYDLRYWIMDTEVKVLTIETDKTSSVSFENVWMGELVIDKQAINSDLLAGWTGDLYLVNPDKSETKIGTYTSDEYGRFAELLVAPGNYIFRETGHSDSSVDLTYWVMAGDKEIVVNAGATASETITNTQLGYGQIIKNTTNGGTKEGWLFEVKDAAGNEIDGSPFTTYAEGKINLGLLIPGDYTVQEIGHVSMTPEQLAYWTQATEPQTLTVVAGTTQSVTFLNQWAGKGTIVKTTVNGGSVAGWQFKVWTDAAEIGIFTTNENGEFSLGLLAPGTYYVQEVGHETYDLRYWIMDSEVKELTIVAGQTATVSFENVWMGELVINKELINSELLAGWTGDLYLVNPDGTETKIGTYTSNESGRFAELLVAPGNYIFRETGHSDSSVDLTYWVMAGDKEIVVNAGATTPATIINTELGYGQIIKDTTNGGIKEGWQFNVWSDSMEATTVTTNENGEYDLGLLAPGIYYVQEIGHATMTPEQLAYWVMDTEVKTLVVEAGSTASVRFENQWKGMGRIKKEMPDGGSVAGWTFDVYRVSDNAYIGEFTSEENGDIALGYLIPGDYRVVERIPEGSLYLPVGGNEKILTVVAGEVKSVTFRNVLRSGEIIVNKADGNNGAALAGAKFLLEWLDNDVWKPVVLSDTIIPGGCRSEGLENGCLVTGEDGHIVFEGLHPDLEYRLTEIEAPNGYALQSTPVFEGKLPVDALSAEVDVLNYGIIELPPTGIDAHLTGLTVFTAIVVCLFFAMVALAIKEGMLTEFIRKHRK